MDPTTVYHHHFHDCDCRNPLVTLVTTDSLRRFSGLVPDWTCWQPRTRSCPVNTVEQSNPPSCQGPPTSLPIAQKRVPEKEGESRTPSIHSCLDFAIAIFPFTFSRLCSKEEVYCLHLKRGDTLILMNAFQPEIFPYYTILVPHTVLFPMISPLLSSECNYLLSLIIPHYPSITPNTLYPHSVGTEDPTRTQTPDLHHCLQTHHFPS